MSKDAYIGDLTDPIDIQNAKSYKLVYFLVVLFYLGCSIWYGFSIYHATQNGATDIANFPPPVTSTWKTLLFRYQVNPSLIIQARSRS